MKPILTNTQVVLFDASCLLYIHGANPDYKRSIRDHIESTLINLSTIYYVGFIDGGKTFRHSYATLAPYKGNRKKENILDLFPYIYEVKKELMEVYKFRQVHGIEVDDVVGILNQRLNLESSVIILQYNELDLEPVKEVKLEQTSFNSVIASIDKDLYQLTGVHYNLKKHILSLSTEGLSFIKLSDKRDKLEGVGFKFFYAQILIGDVTDNIKGLDKCGPVKAYNILKDCHTKEECEQCVKQAFITREFELSSINPTVNPASIKDFQEEMVKIKEEAIKKYNENYQLVYLLRKNKNLKDIQIESYQFFN